MALQTFSGVVVPLSASASQQTFPVVSLTPTVSQGAALTRVSFVAQVQDTLGTFATVNVGFNTNPPPTTGIVYPLFR